MFAVWSVFEAHGYVILVGAVITYYVYQKLVDYLEQKVQSKRDGVQSNLSEWNSHLLIVFNVCFSFC